MSTILVMEEDSAMRALIGEWLTAEGYDVTSVNGMGAGRNADLVIMNVRDLRAQGSQTIRRLRAEHPGAKLIVLSTQLSRSLAGDTATAREMGVCHLVAKPFTRNELVHAVADAVGQAH